MDQLYLKNMFLKLDRALSKFNFLFHLKLKTNLVTLRKCNLHLQYCKIDLSFSTKLQEINLYLYEEYKIFINLPIKYPDSYFSSVATLVSKKRGCITCRDSDYQR